MRYISLIILLILISYSAISQDLKSSLSPANAPFNIDSAGLTPRQKKIIKDHEVYAKSTVKDYEKSSHLLGPLKTAMVKVQSLDFKLAGVHKRSCRYALKKVSLYENYKDYMGFIKNSTYNEKTSRIYLKISHTILPIDMVLNFIIPRIKKPGAYPFVFDKGFLKDLKGEIHVSPLGKECFFYVLANWEGPDTGFSNSLFEFFSKGIAVLAIENLFRVSGGN
ncbi:MAG: hypothetical protein ACJAT2_002681 [Bacteriovoracaceae bacterium]|jgi:hypothetical protein